MQIENEYNQDGEVCVQTVTDGVGNEYYWVYNMDECPEDATLQRNLFTAEDYIATLRLGMRLVEEGYTDIDFFYKKDYQ